MRSKVCGIAVVLLASLLFCEGCSISQANGKRALVLPTPTPLRPQAELGKIVVTEPGQSLVFPGTGQVVSQPFLSYWQQHGGMQIFGNPISGLVKEKDPTTGELYTAQYFERARFELHASTGNTVILGRLGSSLHWPQPPADKAKGGQYFKQTGHNLSGPFKTFWNAWGGVAAFGYPITEAFDERSPADGKVYRVQYFERARFELHPEKAGTPYEVQLGRLGAELYVRRYNK